MLVSPPHPTRLIYSANGLAACFLGSLQLMAARAGKKELGEKAKVHAKVFLGHPENPDIEGLGLRVELGVEGIEDDDIIAAAHEASVAAPVAHPPLMLTVVHQFCAYSRALTQGCEVTVVKV